MLRLIGLLLLIPLVDALLLVLLVPFLGWQLVVLLVVLTALIGLLLVRLESRHTLRRIQRKTMEGDLPTNELIDGGLLIASGAFLLTPGLVTDLVGFLLVIPLTRYPIRWGLKRWVIVPYLDKQTGGFATGNVYVGGFPPERGEGDDFEGEGSAGGVHFGPDDGPDGATGGETVGAGPAADDLGDVTDVEYDEVDDGNEK